MTETKRRGRRRAAALAIAMGLLAVGCGSSGSGSSSSTTSPKASTDKTTTTAAKTTTTTEAAVDLPDGAPAGEVVLQDGFDDDSNGWIGDADYAGSEVKPTLDGGLLTIGGPKRGQALEMWPDSIATKASSYTDQRVTATFSMTETSVGSVLCRVDPEGAKAREYVFTINPHRGTYHIRKYDGKDPAPSGLEIVPHEVFVGLDQGKKIDDIDYTPAFTFDEDHPYVVTGQCVDVDDGVELTMFVDGKQVASVVDRQDPVKTGLGGVSVEGTSDTKSFGTAIDDFVFEDLGSGTGSGSSSSDSGDWKGGDVVETTDIAFTVPDGFSGSHEAVLPFSINDANDRSYWVYAPKDGSSARDVGKEYVNERVSKEAVEISGDPEKVTVGDAEGIAYHLAFKDGYQSVDVFAQDPKTGKVFTFELEGRDLDAVWPAVEKALENTSW